MSGSMSPKRLTWELCDSKYRLPISARVCRVVEVEVAGDEAEDDMGVCLPSILRQNV